MVSVVLSDRVDVVCRRWLASSIACCLPSEQHHEQEQRQNDGMSDPILACHDQPQPVPPLASMVCPERPVSRSSFAPSYWLSEGRELASRASSRASFSVRRSQSRRPTISTPSDFRRVAIHDGRRETFQPLELSIYLPGNRLSPLPSFSASPGDEYPELEYPRRALIRVRSDSVLIRSPQSFTIARKPVPSIGETCSISDSKLSGDARWPRSSVRRSRSHSLYLESSTLNSDSTKDFLAALDSRLPQAPSPLRTRSSTELGTTIHRKASDQSLRLRTHLEERQDMEKRLKEIDTIAEETPGVSPDMEKHPSIFQNSRARPMEGNERKLAPLPLSSRPRNRRSVTLSDFRAPSERPLPPTPLNFNQPNPALQPPPPPPPPKPTRANPAQSEGLEHPIGAQPGHHQRLSTRTLVSQWLFRWTPETPKQVLPEAQTSKEPFYRCETSLGKPCAASQSTVSSLSERRDSIAPTVTTVSSPEQAGAQLPPYQACPPYREFEPKMAESPIPVGMGVTMVGVAV